ncbi:MAG: hypothetical protein IPJ75_02630 [Ignavibacteriales bacterium]|nr:hypothetical protein [Ignavibacteriales bacterium]
MYLADPGSDPAIKMHTICKSSPEIAGILQPVIDGKRCLHDIVTGEILQLEADIFDFEIVNSQNIIKSGKYLLYEESYNWATKRAEEALASEFKLFIIDGISSTELKGSGMITAIHKVLWTASVSHLKKFLFVVRPKHLNEFSRLFLGTVEYKIVNCITEIE